MLLCSLSGGQALSDVCGSRGDRRSPELPASLGPLGKWEWGRLGWPLALLEPKKRSFSAPLSLPVQRLLRFVCFYHDHSTFLVTRNSLGHTQCVLHFLRKKAVFILKSQGSTQTISRQVISEDGLTSLILAATKVQILILLLCLKRQGYPHVNVLFL